MLGMNYQGSKRKIARELVTVMHKANSDAGVFVDLFGGGGAVTCAARGLFERVVYNEFERSVYELFKLCTADSGLPDWMYRFYTRGEFFEFKDEASALGGFLRVNWSFGGDQRSYLYGKGVEREKQLAHNVVVDLCQKSADELGFNMSLVRDVGDMHERRKILCRSKKPMHYQLQHLEGLQRLQHLENLEHLERLSGLGGIEYSNLSYEQVDLSQYPDAVIYCDPPYKGTSKYSNGFDSDAFFEWVGRQDRRIYFSEYNADFPIVCEIDHRSTKSATNNSRRVVERLYCNRA